MQYLAIIEKAKNNFSAYIPDVPGFIATGATPEEVKDRLKEALEMHLQAMAEDGESIPEPITTAEFLSWPEAG